MFGRKEKNHSVCPDNKFYHLKTCNLLENVQFPCTGLPGSSCNEQLTCEWKQVGSRGIMRPEGKHFQNCKNKQYFLNLFPPERQILLSKKEQARETPQV